MLLFNNTILNSIININDDSGYKFLIQVILILVCLLYFYESSSAQQTNVKGNIVTPRTVILNSAAENNEIFEFSLKQNEPNPVFDTTFIDYNLPEKCRVILEIFNDKIDTVATLVNGIQEKGFYRIPFCAKSNSSRIPGGAYFYRLKVTGLNEKKKQGFVDVKKMIVIE